MIDNEKHDSEMTRFKVTEEAINNLKAYQAKLKQQSSTPKQFKDFSHITPLNLEALNWIDTEAMTLKCKPVDYCGECQQGWFYQRTQGMTSLDAVMCRRCEKPRRWMKRLNNMQLPTDAIGMSFDTYEVDSPQQLEAIQRALEWLRLPDVSNTPHLRRAPNMFLYGPPGNGKSSLLYAYAREAAICSKTIWRNGKREPKAIKVKFISHNQLFDDIKSTYKDKHAIDPLKNWLDGVDVLLIDEFGGVGGSANQSAWWREKTINLLQQFSQLWTAGKLQVMLTTNLTPRQVLESLGNNSAAHSRLGAMFPEPIKMVGRDRRVERVNASAWGF